MTLQELFHIRFVQIVCVIIGAAIVNMIGRIVLERLVRRLVPADRFETKLDERKREDTLINVFQATLLLVLSVIVLLTVLSIVGINLAALATGAGLFGIVFGFGAQNAIKNYLAGINILAENQYRVGDIITLQGGTLGGGKVSGVVEEITLRVTKLRDMDGTLNTVANGEATIITNRTFQYAGVVVELTVDYENDLEKVEQVINDVGKDMLRTEKYKSIIVEPLQYLRVNELNDLGAEITILGKVRPAAQWDVAGDFRRRITKAFAEAGITLARRDVVLPIIESSSDATKAKHASKQ